MRNHNGAPFSTTADAVLSGASASRKRWRYGRRQEGVEARLPQPPLSLAKLRSSGSARRADGSDAASPIAAPAMDVPGQVLLIAQKCRVLRQLELGVRRAEALSRVRRLLHLGRQVDHECELLLHVLARAQPAARSGMAWDHTVPF